MSVPASTSLESGASSTNVWTNRLKSGNIDLSATQSEDANPFADGVSRYRAHLLECRRRHLGRDQFARGSRAAKANGAEAEEAAAVEPAASDASESAEGQATEDDLQSKPRRRGRRGGRRRSTAKAKAE